MSNRLGGPYWNIIYGKYWMVQWCFDGWYSLGIHIDTRVRHVGKTGERFGPYIDLHLICFIVSLGINPILSSALDTQCSVARGGIPANE
jgi:hypothetical protein